MSEGFSMANWLALFMQINLLWKIYLPDEIKKDAILIPEEESVP